MSDRTSNIINIICIIVSIITIAMLAAKVLLINIYTIPFYTVVGPGALLNAILWYRNKVKYGKRYEVFMLLTFVLGAVFIWLAFRNVLHEIF